MSISHNVRIKRVYEAPSTEDGYRVLVMRYWPRGIKREAVDEYDTTVAPSRELLREFKHEGLAWEPYTKRYLHEMASEESQRDIERLAEIARTRTITLMCVCEDENRCHRGLLRGLIAERIKKGAAQRSRRRADVNPRNRSVAGLPCRQSLPGPRGCPPPPPLGRAGGQDDIANTPRRSTTERES